jgi:glycosyltransferase involved in cell wall biosynthesis
MLCEKVSEAAYVTPISEYNRKMILEECDDKHADKVTVVHCGVDTEVFKMRTERTPFERGENPFMILCIGTLHEVKGQIYLIEACQKLHARGADFICHFVGDGPDEGSLARAVESAGLSSKVRFHGRLTRNEIAQLLLDADVLVTPSVPTSDGRREGIPVVLMEAMSSGVPVIASNISGIPELVEDQVTGLLVPPRDPSSLAVVLERYLRDHNLRRRLGQAGREKVVAEFDLYKNAARLAQYFKKGRS